MSLIGISSKAGYTLGRNLPKIVKAISTNSHHLTVGKVAVATGHVTVTTAKVVGASVLGLIGAHWIGF